MMTLKRTLFLTLVWVMSCGNDALPSNTQGNSSDDSPMEREDDSDVEEDADDESSGDSDSDGDSDEDSESNEQLAEQTEQESAEDEGDDVNRDGDGDENALPANGSEETGDSQSDEVDEQQQENNDDVGDDATDEGDEQTADSDENEGDAEDESDGLGEESDKGDNEDQGGESDEQVEESETESDTGSETEVDHPSDTGETDTSQNSTTPILQSSDMDPTYATSGPWHGYIWPAVDWEGVATISPSASEGFRQGGPPYCVEGHVPATSSSTAVAMVGMNTNQERAGGAEAATWIPTGDGILVNVSNPGGSPLRLQIQTNETGAIGEEWCAMITEFDQEVLVLWSDFYQHARCADKVGDPFDGIMVGIATVMVLVPGTSQSGGYDFSFCVNEMTPVL